MVKLRSGVICFGAKGENSSDVDKRRKMEGARDFVQWLGQDLSIKILMCLEEPRDLMRACSVSSCWRQFVIMNGLFKQLSIKMFPETSRFTGITELRSMIQPLETGIDDSSESLYMKMEHRAFASLIQGLTTLRVKNCMSDALFASSTDNYPIESVINTLEPNDRVDLRASYWSSKGDIDPSAPETLIFKLAARLCLVTEVHVHPFQAYFQFGLPIYSAKAVRFHLGHPKVQLEVENDEVLDVSKYREDMFVWTYTSPEFPMAQENRSQKFKLPEPILCIGGILKVELLGRVQTQAIDRLYYICITNVRAIGKPLFPAFDVEMLEENGTCKLLHYPEFDSHLWPPKSPEAENSNSSPSRFDRFSASIRAWELMIINTLRRNGHRDVMMNDDDDDE